MIKQFAKKAIAVLLGAAIIVGTFQSYSLTALAWKAGDSYYDLGNACGSGDPGYEARTWEKLYAIQKAYETGTAATAKVSDDASGTLPYVVMEALAERPLVSLEFTFTYKDEKHCVIIPAGTSVADPEVLWYGPEYLISVYGDALADTAVTPATPAKTAAATTTNSYTIQKGDTLNKIAKKLGTTTNDLLAKNPYITNANKIYPGKVIVY